MSKIAGLDWDALRAAHTARVADEVARGLDPIEARAPVRVTPPPAARATRTGGRPPGSPRVGGHPGLPSEVRAQIRDMYADGAGLTKADIARRLGLDRGTVAKYLPHTPQNTTGRPRQAVCGAGLHDMDEHGVEVKSGGRYCAECKRIRAHANYLARKEEKAKARASLTACARTPANVTPSRSNAA